jgi:muramidase (phage lysozyme)
MADDQFAGPEMPSWLAGNPFASVTPDPQAPQGPSPLAPPPASPSAIDPKQLVLNKIYSGEANSYNEVYGGGSFDSYADHPRQRVQIPGTDQWSDAAGAPQFISSTWDAEKSKLGLKDFSPASQDSAAWDLAQTTYKGETGRNLSADAQAGKVQWSALSKQWPSLAGQPEGPGANEWAKPTGQNLSQGPISQTPPGQPAGPAGQSTDLKGLLQLALLQAALPKHKFVPINYDPFKVRPVVGGPVE